MRRGVLITVVLATLFPVPLRADLSSTNFSDLVADSDLILEGKVLRAEILGPGSAGQALLAVGSIHKGAFSDPQIQVKWVGEVHDQRVDRVGEHRLLFLKRTSSGYEGTHYGRSYWVVRQGKNGVMFTPYSYPTSKVKMNVPGMIRTTEVVVPDIPKPGSSADWVWAEIQVVYLDDVVKYVKNRE